MNRTIQTPNKGHRQLRKGRQSIPGAYYSVTLATENRNLLLTTPGTPDIIFQCFDWLETNERLQWICIMVMPDHIHAVFQLGNKQTLSQLMQSLKRYTAKQINIRLVRNGSLWQENYYDHGIRRDESLNKIVRYKNYLTKNVSYAIININSTAKTPRYAFFASWWKKILDKNTQFR